MSFSLTTKLSLVCFRSSGIKEQTLTPLTCLLFSFAGMGFVVFVSFLLSFVCIHGVPCSVFCLFYIASIGFVVVFCCCTLWFDFSKYFALWGVEFLVYITQLENRFRVDTKNKTPASVVLNRRALDRSRVHVVSTNAVVSCSHKLYWVNSRYDETTHTHLHMPSHGKKKERQICTVLSFRSQFTKYERQPRVARRDSWKGHNDGGRLLDWPVAMKKVGVLKAILCWSRGTMP